MSKNEILTQMNQPINKTFQLYFQVFTNVCGQSPILNQQVSEAEKYLFSRRHWGIEWVLNEGSHSMKSVFFFFKTLLANLLS